MKNYYLVKITLVGSDPVIWRRVCMPDDITLGELHCVIQTVMEWENDHLHEFLLGNDSLAEPAIPFISYSAEHDLVLKDYLPLSNPKKPLYYVYDFGDNWVHEIKLEDKNYQKTDDSAEVVCIDGEFAPPPDNIGGVHEYADIYRLLKAPQEERDEFFDKWFDKDYDPDFFDINDINVKLGGCYRGDYYDEDSDTDARALREKKMKARAKKKVARQSRKMNRKRKKK